MILIKDNGDTAGTSSSSKRKKPQTNASDKLFRNVFFAISVFSMISLVVNMVLSHQQQQQLQQQQDGVSSQGQQHPQLLRLSEFKKRHPTRKKTQNNNNNLIKIQKPKEIISNDNEEEQQQQEQEQEQQQSEDNDEHNQNENIVNNNVKGKEEKDLPPYHVVFSTSCDDQQHWESYVFFYHAYKVKQRGSVTRIASGCNAGEAAGYTKFFNKHIKPMGDFHLHLTPDFAKGPHFKEMHGSNRYKYMNKPYGLRHWMEATFSLNETDHDTTVEDGIIFLLDPDMILLRPIVHDFTNENVIFAETEPTAKIVRHGHPMGQQDGYLNNEWMKLNATYIMNGRPPINIKHSDGPIHWNSGPPYIATVRDMYQIAVLWTEYAPRVYDIHPKLFAEMYGYIAATVKLNLPQTFIKSLVVSTTTTRDREGWKYVDNIPDQEICAPPNELPTPASALPVGLHYCERYMLDHWFFSKYRLKKKYISCETPLLKMPPPDLVMQNFTRWYQPPPHGHPVGTPWDSPTGDVSPRIAKREAFMLCRLISSVNEAAMHFKTTACDGKANMDNNYTFFSDPNH